MKARRYEKAQPDSLSVSDFDRCLRHDEDIRFALASTQHEGPVICLEMGTEALARFNSLIASQVIHTQTEANLSNTEVTRQALRQVVENQVA